MSAMRTIAAEYLAMTLPGTPEQAEKITGIPAEQVAALRDAPDAADQLAIRRARLTLHTVGTDPQSAEHRDAIPEHGALGSKGRRPARKPVIHHVQPGADRTVCCWRRIATLLEDDRLTSDRTHADCRGVVGSRGGGAR